MDSDYKRNPFIGVLATHIEPGSKEKEVQNLWENLLWTVFPALHHFSVSTKHRTNNSEPDNKVLKVVEFYGGWSSIDLLVVELKRLQEDVSATGFARACDDYLDDHMSQTDNPSGSILFGAVGIGLHVQFWSRIVPRGRMELLHPHPYHILHDANAVQEVFEYFKTHIPSTALNREDVTLQEVTAGDYAESVVPTGAAESEATFEAMGDQLYWYALETETKAVAEDYFLVRDGQYYWHHNGNDELQMSCPEEQWVYNFRGWSETGRKKQWRKRKGNHNNYK